MSKIIKIPLMIKAGDPNINNGYWYSSESLNNAINSKMVKELIRTKTLYLYEENTGQFFLNNKYMPITNKVAPIVKINSDSLDIEVDNDFNKSRFNNCKAGMIYMASNANKKRGGGVEILRIYGYELINIPTFNIMKEERNKANV